MSALWHPPAHNLPPSILLLSHAYSTRLPLPQPFNPRTPPNLHYVCSVTPSTYHLPPCPRYAGRPRTPDLFTPEHPPAPAPLREGEHVLCTVAAASVAPLIYVVVVSRGTQ